MDCPNCEGVLVKAGRAYGRDMYECRECGHVEEVPDRTVERKTKKETRKWTSGSQK